MNKKLKPHSIKYLKKIAVLLIAIIAIVPICFIEVTASDTSSSSSIDTSEFRETAYYQTLNRLSSTNSKSNIDEAEFSVSDPAVMLLNPTIQYADNEEGLAAHVEVDQEFNMVVIAPTTGLYHLGMMYRIATSFDDEPYIEIKINGEIPFNEASELPLDVMWELEVRDEAKRYNSYGNEMLPYSKSIDKAYKYYFDDVNARYVEPFYFLLNEGINYITIKPFDYELELEKFYIKGQENLVDYNTYASSHANAKVVGGINTIQAESFKYKNDVEIKASYYKDPGMTPAAYKNTVLNMVDGSSSSRGGTSYTYEVEITEGGLYSIAFKYLQNSLKGLNAMKNIYIDGKIPFNEMVGYAFPETQKWRNLTLSDANGNPYMFYLETGLHTITLETSLSRYNPYIQELYSVMDGINSLGLLVASITGSSSNAYNDWNIVKYIPDLVKILQSFAERVDAVYDAINAMNPESREASEIQTLHNASKLLRKLCARPNRIHLKLNQLNSGSGSAYQLIGNAIGTLLSEPMSIDCMYLYDGAAKLPKAKSNIFAKAWFSIKSFVYSFFDKRYKVSGNANDDVLEVWIAQSTLYLDILQNMVDDEYTAATGQKVKISILPSSQKIVLNNATKTNPDLVLSIDSWEPYSYALRGILYDLKQFDDFEEVTSNIYANCFTPVICKDGVYAIPETQGMYIMFYRKDILDYLDLDVPSTWDEVLKMLPILQSYQMNFYHPLGSDSTYKNFGATTQFIYLFGGEVFSESGVTTTVDTEEVISAITYMTDLFNVYNMPLQVSNFFEHFRSGTLPIGVGTIDMYLQLKYASPELTGQWGISPIPGFDTDNDGEVERWATAYGKCSIMFKNSKMKDEAWEFLKWWHSTDTQVEYLQNIQMRLGEKYLIIPANVDALKRSPWDREIKEQISIAAKWSRIPAVLPGSYVVERELSNIWNKVVIDRMDVRVAVSESVDKMNRELYRKYKEFGLVEEGTTNSSYVVPNNSNISRWVKGRQDE